MDRARRSIPNHAGATTSGVDAATNDRGETGDTVDFAHEALIGGWPKLNGWLHQHREGERDRRWLEAKASEWDRLKRQGGLLDEIELAEAERWLAGPNVADLGYSQAFAELLEASRRRVAVERERELARIRALSQARAAASALGSGLGYGAAFGIAFWLEGEARDGWAAALYGAAWFPLGVMFGLVVSIAIALPRLRDAPIRRTVVAVSAGGIVAGGIYVFARRWTVLPGDAYGWEQMVAGALTGGLLAFGIAAPPPERWRRVLQRPGVAGTSHGWMRLAVVTVLGVPGLAGAVWIEHLRWNPGTVILSGLLLGSLTGAGFLLVDVAGRNQPHNQADRPGTGVERPVGRWLRVRRPAARPPIRSWRIALLSVFLLSACGPNGDGGANLSERKDEVFHQAAGGSFDPLPPDDSRELEQGDLVDVSDIGEGRVQFRDGFQVSVFRNTGLQIEGFAEEMSPIDRVQLTGGTLYAASSGEDMEADRRLRVSAGGAVIETLGTEFLVYYDPTFGNISLLWVVVTEGEVEIRAGGRRATVAEGWQIWVEDGIRLSRARPATRPVANWVYPALPMPMLEDLTGSALQDSVVLAGSQCILVADNRSFQAVYRTSDGAWIGDVNNVWVTASQVRCPYPFDALSIGDGPGDSVDQPVVTQDPGQEDEEETPITEPPLPDTTAPPAPAPVEPINDQEISCDEAAAIELGWDEVADASGIAAYAWEMEVSSFPDGPFETLDGGSTGGTSVTYPNLACDHWYQWRVWAIDGAGNQSAPSAPASFSIAPAPEPSEPSNSDVE